MVLLLDNYDSFTYNLRNYILQLGQECMVVRNDEMTIEQLRALHFSSAIISPGPKTPENAGVTMQFIEQFYTSKPILGICLGHQAIGQFFGGKLVKATVPMHGKTSVITHTGHFLFKNMPSQIEVMRYHSLILNQLDNTPLNVIASTQPDNQIMAIAHNTLKIAGVQFHPESILTPHGLAMLSNWFNHI